MLLFQNIISGITSECQIAWVLIRPDILSGLIWVRTVCKGHQQMTKFATSRQRGNGHSSGSYGDMVPASKFLFKYGSSYPTLTLTIG